MPSVERIDVVHGTNGSSRTNGTGGRRRGRNGEAIGLSVNFGPLAHWVGFNLRMAQEAAFQAFSHLSQEIGESPGRFATLTLIARNPGISQTELSFANGRDKSSLTPVVEDLVKRGLVERKRMEHERDGLMWFCEKCNHLLFEHFFPLGNVETDFPPVFERFYRDKQARTCRQCGHLNPAPAKYDD